MTLLLLLALVPAAVATFPPTDLASACGTDTVGSAAQTTCFQSQLTAQQATDQTAIQNADQTAAIAAGSLSFVQSQAAALNSFNSQAGVAGWCSAVLGTQFGVQQAVSGINTCAALCGVFASTSAPLQSSSQNAFTCATQLASQSVASATDTAQRAAAIQAQNVTSLLFLVTQFNNASLVQIDNHNAVTAFGPVVDDAVFNSTESIDSAVLASKANDLAAARTAAANATGLTQQFAQFFVPALEDQPDVTASRDLLRLPSEFGTATQTALNGGEASLTAQNTVVPATDAVEFTDLGVTDPTGIQTLLNGNVSQQLSVVTSNKRAVATDVQVGVFSLNQNEVFANKLATLVFCVNQQDACVSSAAGTVSKAQFNEAQQLTVAELTATTSYYSPATTKYVPQTTTKYYAPQTPQPTPGGGYNAPPPPPPPPATVYHGGANGQNNAVSVSISIIVVLATLTVAFF